MKKKKLIATIIIISIALIAAFILIKTLLKKEQNNMVYLSDGKLIAYINEKTIELGKGELSSIKYKEDDHNKFLYKIDNDLYSFDNESIKIEQNVMKYDYAGNDIVYVDIYNNLYLYRENAKEIDTNISKYMVSQKGKVFYVKNMDLYYYDTSKEKNEKVTSILGEAILTNDKTKITYVIGKENELTIFDLNTLKETAIVDKVQIYNCNEDCSEVYYISQNKELHYLKDKKDQKIDEKVTMINETDFKDGYILYQTENDEYKMYIDNSSTKAVKVFEKDETIRAVKNINKKTYYLTTSGKLSYIEKKGSTKELSDNIFDEFNEFDGGIIYVKADGEKGILYLYKNDKETKIEEDIVPNTTIVDTKNKII